MLNKLIDYVKTDKRRFFTLVISAVLIAVIILLCVNCITYNVSLASLTDGYDVMDENVGGIFDPTKIEQTFMARYDKLSAVGLRFGTFLRKCNGLVHVNIGRFLEDGSRQVITEQSIEAAHLVDNQFYVFNFDKVSDSEGDLFSVIITATGTGDLPVTLWMSNSDAFSDGTLYINGTPVEGDLNIQFYHENLFGYDEIVFIFIFLLLIILVVACAKYKLLIFSDKFNRKYFFPIVFFIFIILFASSVTLDVSDNVLIYRPNFISIISLAVLLIALFLLEKRIEFFSTVRAFIMKQVLRIKGFYRDKNWIRLVIRSFMLLFFLVFAATVLILLTFNAVYNGAKLVLFINCILFVTFYIADSYLSGRNVERVFLGVFVALGLMFCISLPLKSTNTPDEFIHFDRTISLRNALFGAEQSFADKMMANGSYLLDFSNPNADLYINLINDDKIVSNVYSSLINPYSYIAYFPTAFTMFLCDLINADFIFVMMLSRLVNVLVYIAVIYAAIRRLRSGKLIFLTICFAPMPFLLANSFSYDFWVNAWIVLFFSLFITVLQDSERKFVLKDAILISLSMFFACGPKAIYCMLMIPLFFIPKEKFESKKDGRIFKLVAAITFVVILLSFLLPFVVDMDSRTDNRGGADVNAAGQIRYVLTNVTVFIQMLLRFLGEYASLGSSATGMVSYFYLGEPGVIYGSLAVVLILIAALLDKNDSDLYDKRYRINSIACVCSFITIALVAAALYVSFTPVGYYTINGCQYRYIIPTLIPFAYFVGSAKIRHSFNRNMFEYTMVSVVALNVIMTFYKVVVQSFAL